MAGSGPEAMEAGERKRRHGWTDRFAAILSSHACLTQGFARSAQPEVVAGRQPSPKIWPVKLGRLNIDQTRHDGHYAHYDESGDLSGR